MSPTARVSVTPISGAPEASLALVPMTVPELPEVMSERCAMTDEMQRWSNTDPLFKRMPAVQAVAVDPPGSLGVLFKLPKTKSRCSSASRLPVRCQSYGDADQAPRGRRTVLPLVRTRAGARWSPAVLVGAVQASDTSSSRYDGHTTPDGSAHGHVHSRVISQVALPFAAQA